MSRLHCREQGQILAFFALVLPLVLLPVVAYAVDATVISTRAAALQAAAAQAVEGAADAIDVVTLRSGGGLKLDPALALHEVTAALRAAEPDASVASLAVVGSDVILDAVEHVDPALPIWTGSVLLHARASARIVSGYDSPSSF